jgi:hypothetical protein
MPAPSDWANVDGRARVAWTLPIAAAAAAQALCSVNVARPRSSLGWRCFSAPYHRPSMTDKLVADVREWLQRKGYPLEYEVARTMRAAGFRVEQGRYWLDVDPETDSYKPREIDVLATDAPDDWPGEPSDGATAQIVVECKSGAGPWIVLTDDREGQPLPDAFVAARHFFAEMAKDRRRRVLPQLFRPAARYGHSVVEKRTPREKTSPDADTAYQAIMAAARAAWKVRVTGWADLVLAVVVTDSPMLRLSYGSDGSEQLEVTEWERVIWFGAALEGPWGIRQEPILVDVLHRRAVPAFVRKCKLATAAVRRLPHDIG